MLRRKNTLLKIDSVALRFVCTKATIWDEEKLANQFTVAETHLRRREGQQIAPRNITIGSVL